MPCLISVRRCPNVVPTTGSRSALLGPRSVSGCCFARRLTWTDRDLRDQLGRSGNMRTSLIMLRSLVRFQLAPPTSALGTGEEISGQILRSDSQIALGASQVHHRISEPIPGASSAAHDGLNNTSHIRSAASLSTARARVGERSRGSPAYWWSGPSSRQRVLQPPDLAAVAYVREAGKR